MNSDFSSKDTSLWSSGICAVLIAHNKVLSRLQFVSRLVSQGLQNSSIWTVGMSETHGTRL